MMIRKLFLTGIMIFALAPLASAMPPEPSNRPLNESALSGLEALREGKWHDAIKSLTQAIQADRFNQKRYLARGVAFALNEQFQAAVADLARSSGREARLWTYAVEKMSGNVGSVPRDPRHPKHARPIRSDHGRREHPREYDPGGT